MVQSITQNEDNKLTAIADGTITAGNPLLITQAGKAIVPAMISSSVGTALDFGVTYYASNQFSVYDSINKRVVIAWTLSTGGNYKNIFLKMFTVNGATLTAVSSITQLNGSNDVQDMKGMAYDSNNGGIVILYRGTAGANRQSCAKVITVDASNNTFSIGSEIVYSAGVEYYEPDGNNNSSIIFDSTSGKFVLAGKAGGNGVAQLAEISSIANKTMTFHSVVIFKNFGSTEYSSHTMAKNKIVVTVVDPTYSGSNRTWVYLLTIDGNAITANEGRILVNRSIYGGSNYQTGDENHATLTVYDPIAERILIMWRKKSNGYFQFQTLKFAIRGHDTGWSGETEKIPLEIDSAVTTIASENCSNGSLNAFYNPDLGNIFITWNASSADPQLIKGSILVRRDEHYYNQQYLEGARFNIGSRNNTTAYGHYASLCYDSDEKRMIFGHGINDITPSNTDSGEVVSIQSQGFYLNMDNFIGFAASSAADGETVTIDTFGYTNALQNVVSGKEYYLQPNGTLVAQSTAAIWPYNNIPSVGTAVSSTEILIKG